MLNRLKLWQKLSLLVVAMAAPSALLGAFYLSGANAQVALASNEIEGARYVQSVGAMLAEASNHRSRLFALLTGDTSRREEISSSEAEMDKLVAEVDVSDARVGVRFAVSETWRTLKSDWARLKSEGPKLAADEAVARHNDLIDRLLKLDAILTVRSGLNLDPSPETAALIQIATRDVPEALIASGDLRWYATHACIKAYLGGEDRMALRVYHEEFTDRFDRVATDLGRTAVEAKANVGPAVESARIAFASGYGTIQEKIVDAQKIDITTAELYAATGDISSTLQALSDVSYSAMTTAVQQRLTQVTAWRNLTAGITVIALTFALTLSWVITRGLSARLARAISVFVSIAAGKYDNQIEREGADEAAQVLQALCEMQGKLRTQIEAERSLAAENTRIRQALDKVSTSVVLADARYQIIYVNDTAQAMFTRNEREIRKTLPNFDAARLRGANMDVLSIDPGHMRHILDDLSGSDTQERALGACTFRSIASPVVDEKGQRIGTVVEWTDRTQEVAVETQMQNMLSAVVAGDLGQRIELAGKTAFFEAMSRGVNQLADNMAEVLANVKQVAAEVRRGADEISAGNANLSQHTVEQSSSLEETASSMEEMTATVRQNADNAGQANQLARAAHEQAENGGSVVRQAVKAMADINVASRRIADIIGVIDEIAFQTNLLALNAAVEAARAGEQGRGFAVVASEVRSLAGRSATAAKEIKDLIEDSVRKVDDGSVLVSQSGRTLERIVVSVKKVSDIVGEIAAASREQSSGINQVNHAVGEMDQITQQNAALVEQAAAASEAMADQVRGLHEMLVRYRVPQATTSVAATPAQGGPEPQRAVGSRVSLSAVQPGGRGAPRQAPATPEGGITGPSSSRRAPLRAPRAAAVRAPGNATDTDWHEF